MDCIREFFKYNSDARKRYLDTFEKIPWENLEKDMCASFGSLKGIFLHVLNAYRYWFEYGVRDKMAEYKSLDFEMYKSVADLRRAEKEVGIMVAGFLEGIKQSDYRKVNTIHTRSGVKEWTTEELLLHMIEEELQHRGELNCLLWQLCYDAPILSFHTWYKARGSAT